MVIKATRKLLKKRADKKAKANALAKEDKEDEHILSSLFANRESVDTALRIKKDDPHISDFDINDCLADGAENATAWRRLGCILGESTRVNSLFLCMPYSGDMESLCAGLERSRTIMRVTVVSTSFHGPRMGHFASFVSSVTNLREIEVFGCLLGSIHLDVLSNMLLIDGYRSLKTLNLQGCSIGDVDLDEFAETMARFGSLKKLVLQECGIGPRASASLARLLGNTESNLESLFLRDNPMNDDSTVILARSLVNNTKLGYLRLTRSTSEHLYQYGHFASTAGWTALLNLVCDTASINQAMNCNHTLRCLDMWGGGAKVANQSLDDALGPDDAGLLRDALDINGKEDKTLVMRAKVLWGHSRGDFNVAHSSIPGGSMPCILEWIGAEDSVIYTQYQWSRFAKSNFGAVKLVAVYRILRSRPGLCN